jgi:hypothetical protein
MPDSEMKSRQVLSYRRRPHRRWRKWAMVLAGIGASAVVSLAMPRALEWNATRFRRSDVRHLVQSYVDQGSAQMRRGDWSGAEVAIDKATLAACADPTIFSEEEFVAMSSPVHQARADLQAAMRRAGIRKGRPVCRFHIAVCMRNDTIQKLMETATEFADEMRGDQALRTIDQVLLLDPRSTEADELREILISYYENVKR